MLPDQLLLPEELSLFFERVERFAPTAPDFFVEEVRLEAAAVRVLPEPDAFEEPLLLEEVLDRPADERDEVPPVERPPDLAPDFAPDERELDDLVPEDLVADDLVPDFAAVERPEDFVPPDFAPDLAPEDFAPPDLAPPDLAPDDLVPDDLVPDDFAAEDLLADERELAALVPAAFVPDFALARFVPVDLDLLEELFVPPDLELLRADVPLLFRAVLEDFDEPLRERLPLPLEDELPPEFSLWLVLDLSSVGICRLLLGPSRGKPPRLQGNVDICARFQATSSKRSREQRSSNPPIVEEGPLTSRMFGTRAAARTARESGRRGGSTLSARFHAFAEQPRFRFHVSDLVAANCRIPARAASIVRARSRVGAFAGHAIFVEEGDARGGVTTHSPCPKIFFARRNFHVDCAPDVRRRLGLHGKLRKRALHAASRAG